MSAMTAREGGHGQLEQYDMRRAMNMAKMAKAAFSCAAGEETQYQINKPHAEVREYETLGVVIPVQKDVNTVIERHPAMVRQNRMPGCVWLPKQNRKESGDTLDRQRNRCTYAQLTQTADFRADSRADTRADATSARNTIRLNW
jgi:hypothetical protein